jgi:hypothetical protein
MGLGHILSDSEVSIKHADTPNMPSADRLA